jgi:hypothetical protein
MSDIYDLADTWNNAGTVFTAIKMNVTDTASAAASLLLDLQTNGQSRIKVSKAGVLDLASGATSGFRIIPVNATTTDIKNNNGAFFLARWSTASFSIGQPLAIGASAVSPDVHLERDAADTFAQRRLTNPQAFRVYNTFTDASNYERGFIRWNANVFEIGAESGGTGAARAMRLSCSVNQVLQLSGGAIELLSSNTTAVFGHTSARIRVTGLGVWAIGDGSVGATASYPAWKRSGTTIQCRLADDSGFATYQGKLQVHANAVSETITPNVTLRLFDAAGVEYRIPAIAV